MKSWKLERLKYCCIQTVNGEEKYYVMDGNHPVEVSKDVYLVVEHSYHKEWLLQHRAQSKLVSLEQLCEEAESNNHHAHTPEDLLTNSTEDTYFTQKETENRQRMINQMWILVDQLEDEQRALVLSHIEANEIISKLAKRDHVTPRAIYHRRDTVCRTIAGKLRKDQINE